MKERKPWEWDCMNPKTQEEYMKYAKWVVTAYDRDGHFHSITCFHYKRDAMRLGDALQVALDVSSVYIFSKDEWDPPKGGWVPSTEADE